DIAKYVRDPVSRYRRIAFPTLVADDTFPSDRDQFPSLCTDQFSDGYKGRVIYLQESTDWHVEAHLNPFLTSFCKKALTDISDSSSFSGFVTDQLYLHLDHWGNGHVPPGKDFISKVLALLSKVTADVANHDIPSEAIQCIAAMLSQPVTATNGGQNDSDKLGDPSIADLPLDYKAVLANRVDRIADDFYPFEMTVNYSGDTVALPLFTGEMMHVSLSHGVQWERTFATQANSSVMHLFSLVWIGRLLSTFQKRNDVGALRFAVVALNSFLDYSSEPDRQSSIGTIPSADHSTATRIR